MAVPCWYPVKRRAMMPCHVLLAFAICKRSHTVVSLVLLTDNVLRCMCMFFYVYKLWDSV